MSSHSGHSHDNTPAARALCRKMTAAGNGPAEADTLERNPFQPTKRTPVKRPRARVDEEPPVDAFADRRATAFATVTGWINEAAVLSVRASGPVMMGSDTAWTFQGRNGALIVSVTHRGMIYVHRLNLSGRKSGVQSPNVSRVLEDIA